MTPTVFPDDLVRALAAEHIRCGGLDWGALKAKVEGSIPGVISEKEEDDFLTGLCNGSTRPESVVVYREFKKVWIYCNEARFYKDNHGDGLVFIKFLCAITIPIECDNYIDLSDVDYSGTRRDYFHDAPIYFCDKVFFDPVSRSFHKEDHRNEIVPKLKISSHTKWSRIGRVSRSDYDEYIGQIENIPAFIEVPHYIRNRHKIVEHKQQRKCALEKKNIRTTEFFKLNHAAQSIANAAA